MNFQIKKIYKSKLALAGILLISLLFILCSSMVLHGVMNFTSDHGVSSHSSSDSSGFIDHDMTTVLTDSSVGTLFVLVVSAVMLSSLFLLRKLFSKLEYGYIFSIRDRYGGFRILNHIQNLFNKGILNPKIFELVS